VIKSPLLASTAPSNGGGDGEVAAGILSTSATHAAWTKKANDAAQTAKEGRAISPAKPGDNSSLEERDVYTINMQDVNWWWRMHRPGDCRNQRAEAAKRRQGV
jgi:hypothetical protein